MSASYDDSLGTDRDYVRFLVGDTDVSANSTGASNAKIADETIDALLIRYPHTYCAAARLLAGLIARTKGAAVNDGANAIASKTVDGVSVTYGGGNAATAKDQLEYLRRECARQLSKRSMFKVC